MFVYLKDSFFNYYYFNGKDLCYCISLYNIVSRFVDMQNKTKNVSKTKKHNLMLFVFFVVCVYCMIVFILLLHACILLLIVLVSGWWMYVLCYSKNSPAPRYFFFLD